MKKNYYFFTARRFFEKFCTEDEVKTITTAGDKQGDAVEPVLYVARQSDSAKVWEAPATT